MGQADGDPDYQFPPPPVAVPGGPPGTWTLRGSGSTVVGAGATVTVLALTRLAAGIPFTVNYVDTTLLAEIVSNDWGAMDNPGGGIGFALSRYRRGAGIPADRYEVILTNAWWDGSIVIPITMDWRHYEVQP